MVRGAWLKRARELARFKQRDAAKKLGIGLATLARLEAGETEKLDADRLSAMLALYGQRRELFEKDMEEGRSAPSVAHWLSTSSVPLRDRVAEQSANYPEPPAALLSRASRFEAEAIDAGATTEEVRLIRSILRSRRAYEVFAAGKTAPIADDVLVAEMEALIVGLRAWLDVRRSPRTKPTVADVPMAPTIDVPPPRRPTRKEAGVNESAGPRHPVIPIDARRRRPKNGPPRS